MLELRDASYRYAGYATPVLHDINLSSGDGEIVGLVGPNESGKSTLCLVASGLAPASVDVTLVCEHPAIAPRRDEIRASLAAALDLPIDRVSVKATRPEGLGLSGDGIGCLAVAVIA